MADIFYALLIIWVLWRIFGGSVKTHVYHHHTQEKKEGATTLNTPPTQKPQRKTDEGEYVDFEEVK